MQAIATLQPVSARTCDSCRRTLKLLVLSLQQRSAASRFTLASSSRSSEICQLPPHPIGSRPQVEEGASEFDPPPAGSRALIAQSYAVQNALLIEFRVGLVFLFQILYTAFALCSASSNQDRGPQCRSETA